MVPPSCFLLWFFAIFLAVQARPPLRGFLVNCGSSSSLSSGSLKYTPDEGFISVGKSANLKQPGLVPLLSTLRYFPDRSSRKYCYNFDVVKRSIYLIRTIYYYGGFDGGTTPPVFDQIVDGTLWSVVNTTEDYARGLSSYYEIIVAARGKTLSVCLARSDKTVSDPFVSAIEIEFLDSSMYNATDFNKYALSVVVRSTFGADDEQLISYPDDPYNRLWQPFGDGTHPVLENNSAVDPASFWNLPPAKAFVHGLASSRGKQLELFWPPFSIPSTMYYVALYFQDNRKPSPYSWRVFSVAVNGKSFSNNLNVTTNGIMVYSADWPLGGQTRITMTPDAESPVGSVINAGEILQVLPLGGRTNTRDVTAMEDLARSLDNPPADWSGDPCLPPEKSWTGVTCSKAKLARVLSVNLTNLGIRGSLKPTMSKMTALRELWLGGNKLTGSIPDLSSLKHLESLRLENNQLSGKVPDSLGKLPRLKELFLRNNSLEMPETLAQRKGINFQASPPNPPIHISVEQKVQRASSAPIPSVSAVEIGEVKFEPYVKPPNSTSMLFLGGAGVRGLEIKGQSVKLAAIGVYLEGKAVTSLAGKWNGKSAEELAGSIEFFGDIISGPFEKFVRVTMLSPLTGAQYSEELSENCVAHWKAVGVYTEAEARAIDKFQEVLRHEKFPPGSSILFTLSPRGSLTVSSSRHGSATGAGKATIENRSLGEAVLESFVGEHGVSPPAKKNLAKRLSELLKSQADAIA